MAVRFFLVEDQAATLRLMLGILEQLGGFEVVGTAPDETSATDWLMKRPGG